jgi:hypothetical protein
MDPFTRVIFVMSRWWHEPHPHITLLVMLAALTLVAMLILIERDIIWPDLLRTDHIPARRLPHR